MPSRFVSLLVHGLAGTLALLLACAPARAQAPTTGAPAIAPAGERPRVGLVLSGGGARGFAHVGVLKALEAARVPVDVIVGTSMGAIIGGLYASGMTSEDLEREILAVNWGDLFDRREPRQLLSQRRKEEDFELSPVLMLGFRNGEFVLPTGAVSTRSLEMLLRRYTLSTRHLASFDGLPTPFRAVATDMETGQAVVLDHGDLAAALRASMSVPAVFSPLEVDGRVLGDGGLVNNLPVDVARRMGADVVIAVNIGTPLAGRETLGSVVGITSQMVNILTEQNVQASIATLTPRDLLLAPPLGQLTSADFGKAAELVKIGNDYAKTVGEALVRFSVDAPRYQRWVATRESQAQANTGRIGAVASVKFEGVNERRAERLATTMDTREGQRLDVPRLEDDLQRLAALGDFERVDYSLVRRADGAEDLTVHLRENTWGPNYLRVGLDLRTDFQGQGAFNLRISHNRHWLNDSGAEWRNRVQLGETVGLYSEIYQPLTLRSDRFAAAYVDASLRKVELFGTEGEALALVQRQSLRVGADIGWPMGLLGNVGDMRVGLVAAQRRVTPELLAGSIPANATTSLKWREVGLARRGDRRPAGLRELPVQRLPRAGRGGVRPAQFRRCTEWQLLQLRRHRHPPSSRGGRTPSTSARAWRRPARFRWAPSTSIRSAVSSSSRATAWARWRATTWCSAASRTTAACPGAWVWRARCSSAARWKRATPGPSAATSRWATCERVPACSWAQTPVSVRST